MILVGFYTGLRLGDCANLTWTDVDLLSSTLTVKTQKTGRNQIDTIAKTLIARDAIRLQPSGGARLTAMESLCTSSPMNRTALLAVASGRLGRAAAVIGATGLGRGERIDFCGSTGLVSRSMYVFMVSVFLSMFDSCSWLFGLVSVNCVTASIGGSAPRLPSQRNPRSRKTDTASRLMTSHIV